MTESLADQIKTAVTLAYVQPGKDYSPSQESAYDSGFDHALDAAVAFANGLQVVPVIPEGWELALLEWHTTDKDYQVELYNWTVDPPLGAFGDHPTDPWAALREAIAEAEAKS